MKNVRDCRTASHEQRTEAANLPTRLLPQLHRSQVAKRKGS